MILWMRPLFQSGGGGRGELPPPPVPSTVQGSKLFPPRSVYDVIKCNGIDSNCGNHAAGKIGCEAHHLMECISGFLRGH